MATQRINLGPAERIPLGEGKAYRVGQRQVAVFRGRAGGLWATDARCPHRGGPLADGLVGDAVLICPLHGRTFDLRTGAAGGEGCPPLRTYPVALDERGDLVLEVAE
ncbi:MAG: Rieske (2Fe-2S) protein [Myxococcales bacterium]